MTTAATLKTEVETVTGSNDDTLKWLNKAQLLLAAESRLRNSQYIAVTTGGVAAVPATVLAIKALLWDGSEIAKFKDSTTEKMVISTSTTDTPDKWRLLGGSIRLNTSITCTLASATCELIYIPRPATMTATDSPALTDCDEALIAYARWKNYVESEDPQGAMFWQAEWLEEKQNWIELDWSLNEDPQQIPSAEW